LGLLGALMYLGFVSFCFKKYWLSENKEVIFASLAVLSLIASNIFSFSLVTHYSFLAVFIALILTDKKTKLVMQNSVVKKTIIGFAISLIIIAVIMTGRIFIADLHMTKGYLAYSEGDYETSAEEMEKSINAAPFYSEIYSSISTVYCLIAAETQNASYLLLAADANQKAIEISAGSLQSLLDEARIYILAGDYASAQQIYLNAYENIGFNPFLYEKWGNAYFAEGKYAEASIVYDALLEVMPDDWSAPLLSDSEPSEEERIFWKVHYEFLDTLQNAIDSYVATGQDEKAKEIMDKLK
jgi:tetratricopeptide (TPR) repeat protein